jgi:hypothetical protein
MLKKGFAALAFAALVVAGCGGDTTDGGAGSGGSGGGGGSGGSAGNDLAGAHLQSGTYTVSNVVKVSDDCKLTLEDGTFTSTQVVNTQTALSIGKKYDNTTDPIWNPAGYGLGSGPYTTSSTATLTVSTHSKITDDGCEFDLVRTTNVTFTGNNAVSVDFTDTETNHSAMCTVANGEPTTNCTSHYTFDLSM